MKKKILAFLLAAAMMATSMAGCGGSQETNPEPTDNQTTETETNTETSPEENSTETPSTENVKQEITIPMGSDPDTLDPGRASDALQAQIAMEVQETLLRLNQGKLEPAAAESWSVSEDGMVYTFKLRDNKYNDGTPVKAEDYVNSIRRIFDPEVGCRNASIFYCIAGGEEFNTQKGTKEEVGAKAIDDKTLEITLNQPLPYFLSLLTFANMVPVPAARTEGAANSSYGATAEEMVYSGPFMIESWTRGSNVVLTKNPNYWDAANVKLEKITMQLAMDANTRQQMFDAGQFQILEDIQNEYQQIIQPKIDAGEITLNQQAMPRTTYIAFNNNDPLFKNENIRKAFALAFDRDAFVSNVIKKDIPALSWIPNGLSCGDAPFREQYPAPMEEFLKEDPKAYLEKGLEELGMTGQPIEITFLQANSNDGTKKVAEYYQNQWETKLGVKVKMDTASDGAAFNNQVSKGLYQICQTAWGADYNDPMTYMQVFVTGDTNNAAFFSDAEYDELINACKLEQDMKVRGEKFARAEQILTVEKCAISPVSIGDKKDIYDSKLKDVQFNGAGGPPIELKWAYLAENL